MAHDSIQKERRKHPRFQVQALIIAVPSKSNSQVARIIDISKGGMAVRYLDQDNWLGDASHVDVFVNNDFFMTNIPVKEKRESVVDSNSFFSIATERQCCLEFGTLSEAQNQLLDEFISKHTSGNA